MDKIGEKMEFKEFFKEYEQNLEEEKKNLIAKDTHCLVYGVAGSGKSTLLKARSAYLISVLGIDADQIWNISFNTTLAKRAAREFRFQYDTIKPPHFLDLYGLAYKIIKMDHEAKELPIWKAIRSNKSFLHALCKDKFAVELTRSRMDELQQKIAYCKSMMLPESEIQKIKMDMLDFPACYRMYEKSRRLKQFYDMEDLIIEALAVLSEDADVLEGCHQAISFLQVDDLQEISFAGHMLLRTLCATHAQLFATADKLQCIGKRHQPYPKALDSLQEAYPGMQIFFLTKDHRTSVSLNKIANKFSGREVEGVKESDGELKFKSFSTMERMYAYALETIEKQPEQEHVFLYRNQATALPLIDLLKEKEIISACSKSVYEITSMPLMQDMICFIKLLLDPHDIKSFYQVHDYFHLDIPKRVLLEVADKVNLEGMDVYQALNESSLRAVSKKKLAGKMEKIRVINAKQTLGMLEFIMKELQYRQVLESRHLSEKDVHLLAIYTMAERYGEPSEFIAHMERFQDYATMDQANVKILSVEESKGNEFDHVYLLDCMDHLFPTTNSQDTYERALFYTAITRSLHHLELFTFKRSAHQKLDLSPFIFEIYEQKEENQVAKEESGQPKRAKISDLKRGKRIIHSTLGEGKIMKISNGMMQVQFAAETKMLNAQLCLQNNLIDLL